VHQVAAEPGGGQFGHLLHRTVLLEQMRGAGNNGQLFFAAQLQQGLLVQFQHGVVGAAPRKQGGGTWISEEIVAGYCALHQLGYAHSSEVWLDGRLVGGAYGVSIGRMFYGESMFAWRTDASKIALAALVCFCRANGIKLIDCQQQTTHLASLGARPISRGDFEAHLRGVVDQNPPEVWAYDDVLWSQLERSA